MEAPTSVTAVKSERPAIVIKDPDSFLTYLADVLERIHSLFYTQFSEMTGGCDISTMSDIPTPDLKLIIPQMRQSVLKGAKILFTGVIPTNIPPCTEEPRLEQSNDSRPSNSTAAQLHQDSLVGTAASVNSNNNNSNTQGGADNTGSGDSASEGEGEGEEGEGEGGEGGGEGASGGEEEKCDGGGGGEREWW